MADEFVVVIGIPGQGPRALLDIGLGVVVAFTECEQLHEFAGQVLVGRLLTVLVVIEIADHRRVANDRMCQAAEVAESVVSKQLVLLEHVIAVFDGAIAGGEVSVPEEGHLFLQRPGCFDHPLQPPALKFSDLSAIGALAALALTSIPFERGLVAVFTCDAKLQPLLARERTHDISVEPVGLNRLRLNFVGVDDVVDGRFETHVGQRSHLAWCAAEPRSIQQMLGSPVIKLALV